MDKLYICNLKLNLLTKDLIKYIKETDKITNNNIVICPPNILIPYFLKKKYSVGIQNIYIENSGSYTGENSPLQAHELGIKYALIGHGDRRLHIHEDDLLIHQKLISALDNKLVPILFIGETLEENQLMRTERTIKKQLVVALRGLKDMDKVIIAYEPLWKDKNMNPVNVEELINFIKNIVKLNFKCNVKVLYGGNINKDNIDSFNSIKGLDGLIINSVMLDDLNKIREVAVQ